MYDNSVTMHAISLLLRASCFRGLCHQLKYFFDFFHPVGRHRVLRHYSSRSQQRRIGFWEEWEEISRKIPITQRIYMRFELFFLHRDPWVCAIMSSAYFTLWFWFKRCREMVRSVCQPRWVQTQSREKSGEKSQNFTHTSANTYAISLLLRASWFLRFPHQLKCFSMFFTW